MAFVKKGPQRACSPIAVVVAVALAVGALSFRLMKADLQQVVSSYNSQTSASATSAAADAGGAAAAAAVASSGGQKAASWRDSPSVGDASYRSAIPSRQLDRGVVSYGSKSRARRVAAKLLEGKPISVGVIGGSISFMNQSPARYSDLLAGWFNQTFPKAGHRVTNGAVPAIPSSYFALCCYWHVPEDADLVIVELTINDGEMAGDSPMRRSHERLLRKLLFFKNRPAVVELVFWAYPGKEDVDNHGHWLDDWESRPVPYRWTPADDEMGLLAQFYHLPWLGTRGLFWDYFNHTRTRHPPPGNSSGYWLTIYQNYNHPNELGHRFLADLLIHWLQQMLDDVVRLPLEPEDEQEAQEELPEPMYKGNYQSKANTCLMGDRLKPLVTKHDDGWEWKNEGSERSPKFGYISTKPGSVLELTVNTDVAQGSKEQGKVALGLGYLRSYENMGRFQVECISGCACNVTKMDGHFPDERNSQLQINQIDVNVAEACVLKVTVLPETASGKNKVKLLGVFVSEVSGFLLNDLATHNIQMKYGEGDKPAVYGLIDAEGVKDD